MTKDELIDNVKELCPQMLEHENFMHMAECVFCKEVLNDCGKALSTDEFEAWHKLSDKLRTATVAQLIKYLQENFKLNDKLCYMDCVEGCKNDCMYITKDQLGSRFFYYVKELKERNMKRCNSTKQQEDNIYPYVNDNDVIIV